jgi:hypothetical protein
MSPAHQTVITTAAYHIGQLVIHAKARNDEAFAATIRDLRHELAKAERRFTPIIPDLEETSDDDDL